jgi:UDP-glucuronate decarboxylase
LNRDITIYGDGTQTRSFQYVDDLIYGMIEFMKTDEFGPVNIGNPGEFTMNELAQIVKELIPNSISKIVYKELPKDDPIQRKADISKAYKMFGYNPKIELKEGLKRTIDYFKVEIINNEFLY